MSKARVWLAIAMIALAGCDKRLTPTVQSEWFNRMEGFCGEQETQALRHACIDGQQQAINSLEAALGYKTQ